MAPPVLLEEEVKLHPRLAAGCFTRVEEEEEEVGRLDERRPDMIAEARRAGEQAGKQAGGDTRCVPATRLCVEAKQVERVAVNKR